MSGRFVIPIAAVLAAVLVLGIAPPPIRLHAASVPPVQVTDGDTLVVVGTRMRLIGIDAPELQQTCAHANGQRWPCGSEARAALQALVQTDPGMVCLGDSHDRYGRRLVKCHGSFGDLGQAMVAQGMARAYRRYAMDHVGAEQVAQRNRLGIWQGDHQSPEVFRRDGATSEPVVQTGLSGSDACRIKGNITANGRIYHLPGQEFYDKTRISAARGERWFCREAEARAAGWRKAG